jgi:hypothetical protein
MRAQPSRDGLMYSFDLKYLPATLSRPRDDSSAVGREGR